MSQNPEADILTYMFTDLENSTVLWEQFPYEMPQVIEQHDSALKKVVETHGGRLVKTTGDGLFAVFENPADGVEAALAGQIAVAGETWPGGVGEIKVRMGLHTGRSQERDRDYFGSEINLAARVMGLAYGGQILLSEAAAVLVKKELPAGSSLADLGEHRLKGIGMPERIFQLCHPDRPGEFPPLKSLGVFQHNLHRQLSSFIGRKKELAQIINQLKNYQLLTLIGPGGTGKTRLMLQAAEEIIEDYPQGVWLVELASLTNPDQIPERVAAALNVQEMPGSPMIDTLTEYLRRKELLLLLDNVEHIVRESARFSERLLEHCPRIKIMATGREALFIRGEVTIQIPSLSLPNEDMNLEDIADSEGVQLFLERACAVRPGFSLDEQNAAAISDIVRRLDGIPLALELAAARLRMLSVEQINDRLNDRFRLLTGGSRTALPRQQTLLALIDWSWKLLEENERVLLRRLSVFSGGWDLESAQVVTGFDPLDEYGVFDCLEQLINKSLVTVQHTDVGETRYGMLESIRQYAQDKLFDAWEGEQLRDRHVDYIVDFSLEAEKHLNLSSMQPWVERIIQELDNIRSALRWVQDDRPELALRICGALFINWAQWIHPSEVRAWLEPAIEKARALMKSDDPPVRSEDFIKALYAIGFTQALFGNVKLSLEIAEEGIQLAQERGERRLYVYGIHQKFSGMTHHWLEISAAYLQVVDMAIGICQAEGFEIELCSLYLTMGTYNILRGELDPAKQYFQKAEVIIRKYQNPRNLVYLLAIKARFAMIEGSLEMAREYYEQAADAFVTINDQRNELIVKSNISHLLRRAGKVAEAVPYYQDTILKWQEQGNPVAVAHQLECFAFIRIAEGQYEWAARLLGTAKAARERLKAVSTIPEEAAELEGAMAKLTGEIGEPECRRLMAEGAELDLDRAVQLALQGQTDSHRLV